MSSGASFIAIFCIWIIATVVAIHYFMPAIQSSVNMVSAYSAASDDQQLHQQIGLSNETNYTSLTPLGIIDYLK